MTTDVIMANKEEYLNRCRKYIHREGIDKLLDYLENKTDFFTAPSSTSFHLNEDGGLCRHSLNVHDVAMKLVEHVYAPSVQLETAPFSEEISLESLAIATLFHDLCKTKIYRKTERWRKNAEGRWESYSGYEIQDEFPFGHGEKSCIILGWFLRLKQDELLAIRWHMGMFEMGEQGSNTRFAFRSSLERSPLVVVLHTADMLSANLLEKTSK